VHRDLKPDNIMIAKKDGQDWVKVLDFGIAKLSAEDRRNDLTRAGMVIGTPLYMSPEQLSGAKLDARSDIYSFALIVYQMLAASLPFDGDSAQALMVKRLTDEPLPISRINPRVSVPPGVDAALLAALARDCDRRTPTIQMFIDQMERGVRGSAISTGESRAVNTGEGRTVTTAPYGPSVAFPGQPSGPQGSPYGQPLGPGSGPIPMPGPSGQQSGPSGQMPGQMPLMPPSGGMMPPGPMPGMPSGPMSGPMPSGPQPANMPYGQPSGPHMGYPNSGQSMPPTAPAPVPFAPVTPIPMPGPYTPGPVPMPGPMPMPPRKKSGGGGLLIFIGVFVLLLIIGGGAILLVIINKDDTTTTDDGTSGTNSGKVIVPDNNTDPDDIGTPIDPKNTDPKEAATLALQHFNRGVKYFEAQEFVSAAAEFREALVVKPDYPEAQENLAYALYKARRLKEAIEEAKRASDMYGNQRFNTLDLLGRAYYDNRQYLEATRAFFDAFKLNNNEPQPLVLMGFAAYRAGRRDEAREILEKYLQVFPKHEFAEAVQSVLDGDEEPPDQLNNF
ncbi:MAG: protein kinase, partial [Acidobacteriota bacterium]